MIIIDEYLTRTLDEEIDAVAIIPQHPQYVVIGTYNLRKPKDEVDVGETDQPPDEPLRSGSLRIIPFDSVSHDISTEVENEEVDRKLLPCAVVDLHFHPIDTDLLAVATSTGEIRLFRIHEKVADANESTPCLSIIEIAVSVISEADDAGTLPLITHFQWITDGPYNEDSDQYYRNTRYTMVATDSKGDSKLVHITRFRPRWELHRDEVSRLAVDGKMHTTDVSHIHSTTIGLGVESWYVATIPITPSVPPNEAVETHLLLSGGDDNVLLATEFDVIDAVHDPEHVPVVRPPANHFANKRLHTAGIISILPFHPPPPGLDTDADGPSTSVHGHHRIPMLTGSYDDTLRLIILSRPSSPSTAGEHSHKFTPHLITSLTLQGSPWRIMPITSYYFNINMNMNHKTQHYIFLICCMYAGASIVRVTFTPEETTPSATSGAGGGGGGTWTIDEEARFTKGHESMVYAAVVKDADRVLGDAIGSAANGVSSSPRHRLEETPRRRKEWHVLTTSFYDKKVCRWTWEDPMA